jgi:hypothetical protein
LGNHVPNNPSNNSGAGSQWRPPQQAPRQQQQQQQQQQQPQENPPPQWKEQVTTKIRQGIMMKMRDALKKRYTKNNKSLNDVVQILEHKYFMASLSETQYQNNTEIDRYVEMVDNEGNDT